MNKRWHVVIGTISFALCLAAWGLIGAFAPRFREAFIPYHWPHERNANRLTHRTLDPGSKIPEYKVSACHIEKTAAPEGRRRCSDGILHRSVTVHRLPVLC